jgi:hypothetical protein
MAGGPRGPAPKRPDQRRRRNKPKDGDLETQVVTIPRSSEAVGPPPALEGWHPLARDLYESLSSSGQSQFYEPSDWAFARVTCELLSRQMESEKLNANMIAAVMSALDRLLVAEADRRRARLILEHPEEVQEPASVAIMAKYRRAAE